jgi:hypothetical protein
MQTRSTSSTDARRRAAIMLLLAAVLAALPHCKDGPTPVALTECRPNAFRSCDAECGRGVQQCLEPGVWSACACVLLDAGRPDSRTVRDASEGDATDAAKEAGDGEAGDGALDPDADGADATDAAD